MSSTLSPSTPYAKGHQRKRSLKQTFTAPFLRRSKSGTSLLPLPGPAQRTATPPPLPKKVCFFDDDEPILHIVSSPKGVQPPSNPSPSSISQASRVPESPPTTPRLENTSFTALRPSPRPPRTPSPSRLLPRSRTPGRSPPRHRRPSPLQTSELLASSPSSSYIDLYYDSDDSETAPGDEDDEDDFLAHPSRVASALFLFPLPPPHTPRVSSSRAEALKLPLLPPSTTGERLGLGPAFELLEGKLSSRGRRLEEEGWEREEASGEQDDSSLMTPPLSPTLTKTHPADFRLSSSSSGSSSSPSTPTISPFFNTNSPELIGVQENGIEDDFTRRLRALEHRKRERRDSYAASKFTPEQRLARRRSVDALFWRCSLDE